MKNLAEQLRPKTLDEVVGQKHLMDLLLRMREKREIFSLIFYGPPGIGKTSLAFALANDLQKTSAYFNAATDSKAKLVEIISFADVVIIDEIHRLNKDKQDILLPAIEFNKIQMFATTTENPFFVVNPALRSRANVLELKPLDVDDVIDGLMLACKKLAKNHLFSGEVLKQIALSTGGDYRQSLNVLNVVIKLYGEDNITSEVIKKVIPTAVFYSDKDGDGHYDLLSAFHKSLRGSDIDASLYYLAKLIISGDILGIERRMLAVSYEDVGLANPNIALRVKTALDVAKRLGFPEARLPLAGAVIELASAPKSNSIVLAIDSALEEVKKTDHAIPDHLRDSHYSSAQKLNRGKGYKYPHDFGGYVKQQYLPNKLVSKKFYIKNNNDKEIK